MNMNDQLTTHEISRRKIVAVEHPMIIKNLDNGIKTFGTNLPFERVSHHLPHKSRGLIWEETITDQQ